MRADWTASGACTSGSTATPRGATRRASGGAAMTSTTRNEHDANARTGMACRRGGVPCHVGRDDGGDDAAALGPDAMALQPGRPRPVDHTCGRGLLRRLDRLRDRKSTRLNSSHGYISYAVFCLKKKKKKNKKNTSRNEQLQQRSRNNHKIHHTINKSS